MQKTVTLETYRKRIERVLEYIAANESAAPDLYRLAEEAHLSPHHFHRVYVAMMGETLADTLRRRRLHAAAVKLLGSNLSLARIASEAKEHRVMFNLNDVKIERVPAIRVVALRHHGDYQQIGSAFERLMAWVAAKGLRPDAQRSFGIYYDDPCSKPAAQLVADACIEAPATLTADGAVRTLEIPAMRCAAYIFKGPYAELEKPYRWLYDTWLPQSGEEIGAHAPFEEYLNDARTTPPTELLTRILVPLAMGSGSSVN